MSGFDRLEKQIHEAHVQRSAAVGAAVGGAIADAWMAVPDALRWIGNALRGPKSVPTNARKRLPLPMR